MGFFSRLENTTQTWVMRLDMFLRFFPRLAIGLVFIPAGWAKLLSLSRTISYFQSLDIPMAMALAPIVALLEITCGVCILIGLYTRIACLPLIAIMTVALMTAHKSEFSSLITFFEINQGLYIVILSCVFALGSGTLSLEQMFFRRR